MEEIKGKNIAVWFSCGVASAIAAKKTIEKYGKENNIMIVNNPVKEEHKDNLRFKEEVQNWLDYQIIEAKNKDYPNASIVEIFDKRKYMSGREGAPCTMLLKKAARYQFECNNEIDYHVLGFTADEKNRFDSFVARERANTLPVLIEEGLTKDDCFQELFNIGIKRPLIYDLQFPNANCIGCVKSQSPTYWNLVRAKFPDIFEQRVEQSRRIGCKLVMRKRKHIFLDELLPTDKGRKIKSWECGIFCDTD